MEYRVYIDYGWYLSDFGGCEIPESEFDSLAAAASHIIDAIVTVPVGEVTDAIRLAAAYEAETLFGQGGPDALSGMATVTSGIDERLGDYSIGTPYVSNEKRCYSVGGIPVSDLTLSILYKEGLMCRAVYG